MLSPARYNAKTGLMVCCPLTARIKGDPFEVAVSVGGQQCVVLSDQVKSLDWKARKATPSAVIAPEAMAQMRGKLKALLQIPRGPASTRRTSVADAPVSSARSGQPLVAQSGVRCRAAARPPYRTVSRKR